MILGSYSESFIKDLEEVAELKRKIKMIVGKIMKFTRSQGFLPIKTIGLTQNQDKVSQKYNKFYMALNNHLALSQNFYHQFTTEKHYKR